MNLGDIVLLSASMYPKELLISCTNLPRMTFILTSFNFYIGFPDSSVGKNLPAMQETPVGFLGWEDPLEEGMATHSSTLACRFPWTEEPGGLVMWSQTVGHG